MIITMILTNAFSPDVRVYKEAKYLVGKGHKVTILCWDKTPEKGLPLRENKDGINIIRFGIPSVAGTGMKQSGAYFKFIRSCRKYLKKHKCDCLHCHDLDGALVGYLTRKAKTPFVFDMHEFYEKGSKTKKTIIHWFVMKLVSKAKAVIYVSNESLKRYGKQFGEKFYVLRNYSDPSFFTDCKKVSSERFRIAYIGEVRNQIPEFTALFEAVKGMDNVRVDIYGGGVDLPRLEELKNHYSNVTVHGRYDGIRESNRIYSNTDVSFIAYDTENPNYHGDFEPVKLYEAVITGTPIIATGDLNPGRLAEKERIGLSVDTKSADEIQNAIHRFISDKDFFEECKNNMEKIAVRYDWNNAVRILDRVYLG